MRKILDQIKFSVGFCTLSFVGIALLSSYSLDLNQTIENVNHRLAHAHRLAARTKEVAIVLQDHQDAFTTFTQCQFEKAFTAKDLRTLVGHSCECGRTTRLNSGLISQEVTFSASGLQDGDIFSFIDRLATKGPGIFQIREISITRIMPLSEEILQKIAAGLPQSLVEGHIVTTWIHR